MAGEVAQAVDHGVGLEGAVDVAQRDERARVEVDVEGALQLPGERGVEVRLAAELQLDVLAVAAQRERTQQDGRAERAIRRRPGGEPMPRRTASMPRVLCSSRLFAAIRSAARRAARSEISSRMSCDSRVLAPVMNRARPPGCVLESSMRVIGSSMKCSSGDGPPRVASSARQWSRTASTGLDASTARGPDRGARSPPASGARGRRPGGRHTARRHDKSGDAADRGGRAGC